MKRIPISEKELKFWNEQLKAFDELKKDLKQEEEKFKKEKMFLNIFLMPVVGVAIIARFIFEALKHGWQLGSNIIEVLG